MKISLFLASLLITSVTFGQQIQVKKVKGNKAVVEFTGNLNQGQTYSLGGRSSPATGGNRDYVIGGSLSYFSGDDTLVVPSLTVKSKSSDLNMSFRFGWNFKNYEVGPLIFYRNVDSDYQAAHYTTMSAGAFADYNFTPNHSGETMILAATGEVSVGTYSPQGGSSGNALGLFTGGSVKWFGLTNTSAVRADLGLNYQKNSISNASIESTGFALRCGISTYF